MNCMLAYYGIHKEQQCNVCKNHIQSYVNLLKNDFLVALCCCAGLPQEKNIFNFTPFDIYFWMVFRLLLIYNHARKYFSFNAKKRFFLVFTYEFISAMQLNSIKWREKKNGIFVRKFSQATRQAMKKPD